MSDVNSTDTPAKSKVQKPYPEYPLTPHPSGRWCKKIRGKLHYFGKLHDPQGALNKYLEQKEALHAGRKPREDTEGNTVWALVNRFLDQKETQVDGGELSPRTWTNYKLACDEVVAAFGKRRVLTDLAPSDFTQLRNKLAKTNGPHRLGNLIQCIRTCFKFGFEEGILAAPVRYGPVFKKPSKKTLRLHRARSDKKLFTADEIRKLLDAAGSQLRCMIYLGINCGFGNSDCGHLPLSAVDLDAGIIDFPRPKTGIPRRSPLWPETIEALRVVLAERKEPKDPADAGLLFVTKYGDGWSKTTSDNPVTKEFRKLLNKKKINGHRGFYCLRHTHRTVSDCARDQPGADFIMGHEAPNMSTTYREEISDDRLKAVVDHVRQWLFDSKEATSHEAK